MQRTSNAWRISSEWANKMGQSWSITHGKQKHKHVILQKQAATVTARTLGCVGINCVKSLYLKVNQGQTKQSCRNRSWPVFPTANFFTLMTFEKTSHCISGSPETCSWGKALNFCSSCLHLLWRCCVNGCSLGLQATNPELHACWTNLYQLSCRARCTLWKKTISF